MSTQPVFPLRRLALFAALVSLLTGLGGLLLPQRPGGAQSDTPPVELNANVIKQATVFVMQTRQSGDEPVIVCVGSGTLVSSDGLILTNAHTALSSAACPADTIVIAVTLRLDEPPIPIYAAEVVDFSRGLDLAVLRITGYLDGREIEPGSLQLPFVELGDSNAVALDDTITVAGYPSFGSEPVALVRGTISGFTAEARVGDRAWLRTSAVIPGTMSGGGVYNRDGRLIGIPTIAPASIGGEAVDCRIIQDTNQDGRADRSDGCVPVGGFISALRPAALARGLVRAATLGIRQGETLPLPPADLPAGKPTFRRLLFTTRVNEAGMPTNVISRAPTGTTSLYLFFDYDNMVDGMVYELRVTVDGIPDPTYSLPPVNWSGGRRGLWYIGSAGLPWRSGLYDFRLFIEGSEAASQRILIEGPPASAPQFSDLVFGLLDGGALVGTGTVLPEGSAIQAQFVYRNMAPGLLWSYVWYYEGQELSRDTTPWDAETYGAQGTRLITAQADFLSGTYRLELYIEGSLSATADFVIAGGAEADRSVVFTDFRFSTGQTGGTPAGAIRTEFPAGIEQLYVFFNWRLLAPGTLWTRRWLVDGEVLFEITEPWQAPAQGENYYLSLDSLAALPDATYGLEISLANVTLERASARVGLGQLPVGAFASAEGVQMAGRITDTETGQGIPGALFIVLKSEYSIEDFLWDRAQVFAVSLADSRGYFQVPILLPRGTMEEPQLYSVLVRAAGYLPVSADGIVVTDQTASPVEINAALTPY